MQDEQQRPDLSLFLASAAHDMKNSVGMMSGTLETLLADEATKQLPAYQQIAHMLYETRRLNDNLIQLLALYKDVGKRSYPFDPEPQALVDFVEQIESQYRILFSSKNIELQLEFPDDLVWVFDADLVTGVIGHAITNAIRYTRDRIALIVRAEGDFLELRVEDNGEGYPPSMIEMGLEMSAAMSGGVNFKTGSTYLGLYFSGEVAKMHTHRGRVGGVTLENGGSLGGGCFVLRLP
ncbi:MAG: HAMP domain-containing histidine kinase [Burkholderiaceae bacterium]|nr:HAMP domain-containing histidine kinase [Burkholderiaceae bacterium]